MGVGNPRPQALSDSPVTGKKKKKERKKKKKKINWCKLVTRYKHRDAQKTLYTSFYIFRPLLLKWNGYETR